MEGDRDILKHLHLTGVRPSGRNIGVGAYGRVFEVELCGELYAAKEIHSVLIEGVEREGFERMRNMFIAECLQSSILGHENVVRVLGVYNPGGRSLLPVLVMERMQESLTSLAENHPNIPMYVKLSILLDVSRGLWYLHSHDPPIVHRDLSPNNVLLTSQFVAKISDLGVAKVIKADSKKTKTRAPGTVDFMPPEALQPTPEYGPSLDVFSYGGVILHTINQEWPTTLHPVVSDPKTGRLSALSEVERRQKHMEMMRGVPADLRSLVMHCLDNQSDKRPLIADVSARVMKMKEAEGMSCPHINMDPITWNQVEEATSNSTITPSAKQSVAEFNARAQVGNYSESLQASWKELAPLPEEATSNSTITPSAMQSVAESNTRTQVDNYSESLQDSVSSRVGHKTIGKKVGKMWTKFMQRKSLTVSPKGKLDVQLSPNPNAIDDEDDMDDEVAMEQEPWYYDPLPRIDADRMVKIDGDYLVRFSETKGFVLTTKWEGQARHFVIQKLEDESGRSYRFEGTAFPTIRDLLLHYVESQTPITKRTQAVLKRPICKQVIDDDRYIMSHGNIILDKVPLGRGHFGDVFSGTLRDSGKRVVVKTCCSEHIPETQQFVVEAKILKQYDHPNIVRLLGVCADKHPMYIVIESMPGGNFLCFLRNHGINESQYQLTKFALDAALGMEYLTSQNCIHCDLAARNCLVGEKNEVLKISDFGMSQETEEGIYTPTSNSTMLYSVKWTAPEALNIGQFTSASDVWSYGVLLFETYSCGASPYPGMNNAQAREDVEQGNRMIAPEGTPKEVYDKVMWQCWYYDPEERPSFSDIVKILKTILSKLPKK